MQKLILPILCGVFALFFSGTPITKHNNCGPFLTINNLSGGAGTIGVTSVVIFNATTGVTTTYNSPTFPFNHNEEGGTISVTYNFDGTYNGCWVTSPPCNAGSFTNKTSVTLVITEFDCDIFTFQINRRASGQACFQCAP